MTGDTDTNRPPTIYYETTFSSHLDIVIHSTSDFIFRSGKIVRAWDNWYEKWFVWYPIKLYRRSSQVIKKMFIMRFRGLHRGRHWDRKCQK
jgi:hypothetical protein